MKPILTSLARRFFCLGLAGILALAPASGQEPFPVPQFRQIDATAKPPQLPAGTEIRLLADSDFPPFSFVTADGRAAGIAVDLAQAACAEIRAQCRIALKPFDDLMAALARAEGDAVIAGPRLSAEVAEAADPTRPIYRATARFAARRDSPLTLTDAKLLETQRIGAVRGTSHAAWLGRYYARAALTLFDTDRAAREALKAGQLDLLFGDALRLTYWIEGEASKRCCKLVGGGYNDPRFFSQAMVFLFRRDKPALRQALDYGLDRMQASGTFAEIVRRYVPASPW